MENFSGASVAYFTNSFALDRIEPNKRGSKQNELTHVYFYLYLILNELISRTVWTL